MKLPNNDDLEDLCVIIKNIGQDFEQSLDDVYISLNIPTVVHDKVSFHDGIKVIIWVPLLSSWPISFCVHHGATKASSMNNFPASTALSGLSYDPISGKTLCTYSD